MERPGVSGLVDLVIPRPRKDGAMSVRRSPGSTPRGADDLHVSSVRKEGEDLSDGRAVDAALSSV
jgi:hypothetical protein